MKRFTLTCILLCAACAFSFAGTESYSSKDKEVMQQAPPPCDWYRAHEWDFSFWGTYAFPANTGTSNDFRTGDFDGRPIDPQVKEHIDIGHVSNDRFLNRDQAWGGGLDVKYFFNKYMAFGGEGYLINADANIAGGGLGTFTFRWPIGCSRFAPYGWAGLGVSDGGSHSVAFFNEQNHPNGREPEFRNQSRIYNTHALFTSQLGAGMEIRMTRHIGLMGDFAWNFLQEGHNDFGMARFGVNLSY